MQAHYFLQLPHPSKQSQVVRLVVQRTRRLILTERDPALADLVRQGPKVEIMRPSHSAMLLDLMQRPLTLMHRVEQHGSDMRTISMYISIRFVSGAAGLRVQRRLRDELTDAAGNTS
uniref:Uncharacterized protein n=1 Tax=Tetradesmus obliquus TaxID=3088 RepID=A0A383VLU2_TETOB